MSWSKLIVFGTTGGVLAGTMSLAIAQAVLSTGGARFVLPAAVIISAILGSAAAGSIGVILSSLLTRPERTAASTLIAVAVAALMVLPGNYANSSQMPLLIYVMAAANGMVVAQVIIPLCAQVSGSVRHYSL